MSPAHPYPQMVSAPREASTWSPGRSWRNLQAIGGVVLLEMYRRKDFYVLFVLTALITLVLGSINFFNEDKIVRYLKEICLLLIWVSSLVIAVTSAARQLPTEREQRTLFPLLAKPVTRTELVLGKFCGCWLVSLASLLVFYLFFALVSGAREHVWPVATYLQAFTLHGFMLAIVIAMSLLGSLVFAAPSSNTTILLVICAGILLLGRHLNKVALQLAEPLQSGLYAIYYLLPHLELFDVRNLVVHNWGTVPWGAWAGALLYAAVYAAMFLSAAAALFRRQALN